ncbi:MAG: potassium transporter TrkG, partial [Angelakisella sp.]
VGTVAFLIFEWGNPKTMGDMSFFDKLGAALFQSITSRTAGYNSIDQAGLTDISKIFCIALMFIGAAPASTGGGIKVTTAAVVIMTIVSVMRGYDDTVIMKYRVEKKAVYKAMALLFLALLLCISCSMLIHFMTDTAANPIDVVFEEVSAFGTVGLSTGLTAQLGTLSRYVLILSMYLGRVGPLSMVISLAVQAGRNKEVLPQGKILIG